MHIKILGPGCRNCQALEKNTRAAVADLALEATVEKVTDYAEIAGYGILQTPGLVIDDEVVLSGRVPTTRALCDLLRLRA